ncbi:RNA polymerase II subunit A C-terminal domain phosphatase-like isoform X2 [Oratosquilla oratoria]|uniref:RNA polymerase II subunit A C-terminal domain phosphatase-like isoform X2 n=1 Tax=Oratosquilla oratoria TaxID=337810 RepID=UPI003F774BA4
MACAGKFHTQTLSAADGIKPGTRYKVKSVLIKPGGMVFHKKRLLELQCCDKEAVVQVVKSMLTGTISKVLVKMDDVIMEGAGVVEVEECSHATLLGNMCCNCGATVDEAYVPKTQAVSMLHSIPDLKVSKSEAEDIGKKDISNLLVHRKLVLLVDLDQTLIHTTNDNIPPNLKDVYHFKLVRNGPWYHTRLRPFTRKFLESMAKLYELHICTFGVREYAHYIANFLDPDQKLFGQRILSRNECLDPMSKKGNLNSLFPCGDNMVCIIDDRTDVWNFAPNVVQVLPYHFFKHTGDINAPPGLQKKENDEKKGHDFSSLCTNKEAGDGEDAKEEDGDQGEKDSGNDSDQSEEKSSEESKSESSDKTDAKQTFERTESGIEVDEVNQTEQENRTGGIGDPKVVETSVDGENVEKDDNQVSEKGEDNAVDDSIKEEKNCVKGEEESLSENEKETRKQNKSLNEEDKKEEEVNMNKKEEEVNMNRKEEEMNMNRKEEEMNMNRKEEEMNMNRKEEEMNMNRKEEEMNMNRKEEEMNMNRKEEEMNMNRKEEFNLENQNSVNNDGKVLDVSDCDDYLLYLEEILRKLHEAFYMMYDTNTIDKMDNLPDLKVLVPYVRSKVLAGCHLVFSGVVPQHIKLQESKPYQIAISLGAIVTERLVVRGKGMRERDDKEKKYTTHVVAANLHTEKVHQARKYKNVKIVTPNWLWTCAERWEHVEEQLFLLTNEGIELEGDEYDDDNEEENESEAVAGPSKDRRRTPSGSLIGDINPLAFFSNDDMQDMDKEVEEMLEGVDCNEESRSEWTESEGNSSDEDAPPNKRSLDEEEEEDTREETESTRIIKKRRSVTENAESSDEDEDELPSIKFRQGGPLPSDDSDEDNDNEDDSEDGGDDWGKLGADLERELWD